MTQYEIHIEEITPCGGAKYARKAIIETEAESPEAYVRQNGRFPILEISRKANGDVFIRTGDGKGYYTNYIFTQ